jgi:hypothetical protein
VSTCTWFRNYSKATILYISASFTWFFWISDELILDSSLPNIHQNRNSLLKTASPSALISSHWSDVNGKLDSNIVLAETLLNMLHSLNTSSTMKIDLFHMYIRQFLVEFDARIRFDRKRKKKKLKK